MKLSILQDFHEYNKHNFDNFLTGIQNGIYSHTTEFTTPSLTKIIFDGLVSNYRTRNYAFETGGRGFKPDYEIAFTAIMGGLDNLRLYVLGLPNLSVNLIQLSGFHENKQSISSSVVPGQPIFKSVTRPGGAVLTFEFKPVDGAEYYGVILVEGGALPANYTFINGILDLPTCISERILHNFNSSKISTFSGLKLGILYHAYCYCGNSAGVSILSEGTPVTCSNK